MTSARTSDTPLAPRPVLTVSIAGYNVERTIAQALDSVLQQSVIGRIEVLVCDDGGTDTTADVVAEYASRYPATVRLIHKDNGGYGSVVNTNIRAARGVFFKQLDGDDWFLAANLPDFVDLLEAVSAEDPAIDLVTSQIVEHYEPASSGEETRTQLVDHLSALAPGPHDFGSAHFENFASMHECALRTDLLRAVDLRIAEKCFYSDVELPVRAAPYLRGLYVWRRPLYVYRKNAADQSMAPQNIARHYRDHERVLWDCLVVHQALDAPRDARRRAFVWWRLRKEACMHFRFLCLLPDRREARAEIRAFERRLAHACPQLLAAARAHSMFVRLLLDSRLIALPLCARMATEVGAISG